MKFRDSSEFRKELDNELRKRAQQSGRFQDLIRLQEELAIERFLARIDPAIAIIKGGAAAMFMIPGAPHTRDVDMIISEQIVRSLALIDMQPDERATILAELIEEQLRMSPKEDFFRFKLEDAFAIRDLKPEHACVRINFSVMVGKADLHFLQLDIALGDGNVPSSMQPGNDLLNFAAVPNPMVRTVTAEFLIADKITLYLEEHGKPDADRVKDIVHTALLLEHKAINKVMLIEQLARQARKREVTEKLKSPIPDPPEHWQDRFDELMEPAHSIMTITEAMDLIKRTINPIARSALKKMG